MDFGLNVYCHQMLVAFCDGGELGDLSESLIACLAVISFLQLLCKLWGFELGDKSTSGYCAHVCSRCTSSHVLSGETS